MALLVVVLPQLLAFQLEEGVQPGTRGRELCHLPVHLLQGLPPLSLCPRHQLSLVWAYEVGLHIGLTGRGAVEDRGARLRLHRLCLLQCLRLLLLLRAVEKLSTIGS